MKFGDLGGSHTHLGQTEASIGQCRTEICCLLGPETKLQGISEKSENLLNVGFFEGIHKMHENAGKCKDKFCLATQLGATCAIMQASKTFDQVQSPNDKDQISI